VIDGLFPDSVLEGVLEEYPEASDEWRVSSNKQSRKFGAGVKELELGPVTRNVLAELNSSAFMEFLQTLTGIEEGLIPDPHFAGGGLHQILPGGFLEVHADFNRHPRFDLDRRLNVLLYLNKDWQPEWGGQLELWDPTMTRAEQVIDPVFNRTVIFSTTDTSYHGHPDPLRCPEGRSRRSLATYYYSNGRPEDENAEWHSTLWQQRPAGDTD
jgi:Rps23 Pro-64 3,4-dihydroxylase Tpa1-like proline 4-hydroxylase